MNLLIKIMSFVPWVYLFAFYSYVVRVAIEVGHMPSYNNPDPSYMHVSHRNIIMYSFEVSFWGSIIGVFLLAFFAKKIFASHTRRYALLFVVGVFFLVFNIFIDPLDTWFLD